MTSNKPYLIRAIYEWILDNKLTPYIVINTEIDGVQVPEDYVKDNNIVLDISPEACLGLHLGNDRIVFSASFSGVSTQIFTPPHAVLAIYAKENGEGMIFSFEKSEDTSSSSQSPTQADSQSSPKDKTSSKTKKNNSKTILKIVK